MTEPTVVYIAGSGRSGSTLVERMLGAVTGYVNVGEIIDLPRRVVTDDELCGCGEPFSGCPFWTEVGRRLGTGPDDVWRDGFGPRDLQRLDRLQKLVARQRHLPRLLAPTGRDGFAMALEEYGSRYRELFAAVRDVAGADYVVDASKWPSQVLALYRGGVDVRVLHLVRDVRGVAYSLSKTVERPHARDGGAQMMYSNPIAKGAAHWLTTQTEMDLLAAAGVPIARVQYGDLMAEPQAELTRALTKLGCGVPADGFAHISRSDAGAVVSLDASHGLSGNPSRFKHGDIVLRSDDAWRSKLRKNQQRVALAVGLPQVARYRLRGRA